ncbi:MAG: hypothetical protein WC076_03250 [Terrimicrobiaceae bacterium]
MTVAGKMPALLFCGKVNSIDPNPDKSKQADRSMFPKSCHFTFRMSAMHFSTLSFCASCAFLWLFIFLKGCPSECGGFKMSRFRFRQPTRNPQLAVVAALRWAALFSFVG